MVFLGRPQSLTDQVEFNQSLTSEFNLLLLGFQYWGLNFVGKIIKLTIEIRVKIKNESLAFEKKNLLRFIFMGSGTFLFTLVP